MAILSPDATLIGTIRGYPAAWRERVSQILQAIQTKFTNDETERVLSNKLIEGWNGTCDPNPVITLTSDGVNWALTLTGTGTVDLACFFGGVEHTFDTTPAASINLTAGTDISPQANFIYLTESGGTVSLNNDTSGYPATAHIRIADCLLQSVASGQTFGAYLVHQHSEHINSADSGAIVHHSEKIRELGATWFSGVAPANMVVSAPDAFFSVGAGVVHQLHSHDFPAINMQTPATVYVVNDPTTPFKPITTLDDITQDALGNTINNRHFSLVLWGGQNANDAGQLFINLPTGTYPTAASAARDAEKFTVFSFPTSFKGTAFEIAEYRVQGKDSGTWVQNDLIDLRGQVPSTSPGGGPGITAHSDLSGLPSGDAGHTGLVPRSLWDANSVLVAVSDDTPIVQAVAASEFVGRKAAGNVGAMSKAEALAVLNVEDGATADQSNAEIKTAYEANANTNEFSDAEQTLLGNQSGVNTGDEPAASPTVAGVMETAIASEVNTGTDTGRAVSPSSLAGSALQTTADGAVPKSTFNAQSYLKAILGDTPVVQAVADSEFVGRAAGEDLGVMTAAQAVAVLTALFRVDGSRALTGTPPASPAANSLYKHPNAGGQIATAIDASSAEAAIAGALDAAQGGIATGALEDWHEIGAASEPAFANSWVNFGGGLVTAAFRKLPTGEVYIKGFIKDGTIGAGAFTLPVGYRPLQTYNFIVLSGGNILGTLQVGSNGLCLPNIGNNAFHECGVSFIAEQ